MSNEGKSVRLVEVDVIAIRGEKKAGALIDRGTAFVDVIVGEFCDDCCSAPCKSKLPVLDAPVGVLSLDLSDDVDLFS